MAGSVWIVQIGCVGVREGDKMDAGPNGDYPERYERVGGALAALYGALLGMRRFDPGYIKLRDDSGETPDFGFEGDSGAGDEPHDGRTPTFRSRSTSTSRSVTSMLVKMSSSNTAGQGRRFR